MTLIDDLTFDAPKTKDMAGHPQGAEAATGSSLLVTTAEHDVNVYKSARNIDQVDVAPVSGLNALNLLLPRQVLMTKAALDAVRSGPAREVGRSQVRPRPSRLQAKAAKSTSRRRLPAIAIRPRPAAGLKIVIGYGQHETANDKPTSIAACSRTRSFCGRW